MSEDTPSPPPFEPTIVGFLCNWCSYRAADLAGTARIKYQPNVRVIRVMCSGRVDPSFVLKALARGADGVMIAGCHPGECHYLVQNYKTIRRFHMLKATLRALGIEDARVRLQWASAAEGQPLADGINAMVDEIRALGPLDWPSRWPERAAPGSLDLLEEMAKEHAECLDVPAAEVTA